MGDTDYLPPHFEMGYSGVHFGNVGIKYGDWASNSTTFFARFDALMSLYEAQGIKPFYDIGQGFGGQVPSTESWASYCTAVATRYEGRLDYGLGNEWDTGSFWPGTEQQAFDYMKAASVALRAADDDALIVSNGTTSAGQAWLGRFLDDDGVDYIDAVAFHPYVQGREPEYMIPLILNFKRELVDRGLTLPMRATENAWHQWYNSGSPVNDTWDTDPGDTPLPEQLAADYVVRSHLVSMLAGLREHAWFVDEGQEFNLAYLVDPDNTANLTPAGDAYQFMVSQLSGATLGNSRDQGLMFIEYIKDGQTCRVYWRRDGESGNVDLSGWTSGKDVFGDAITLSATYNVTDSPIYVLA